MKISYFVYDLNDAAVRKRVMMFQAGGAQVCVVGFHRQAQPPNAIEGAPVTSLGRTFDGKLAHRMLAVLRAAGGIGRWMGAVRGADVIVARNLETLALATEARALVGRRATLIYESLDIHRSLLSGGATGKAMRAVEKALMRAAALVMISSPAFLANYFAAMQGRADRTLLVENKVLDLSEPPAPRPILKRPPGPAWRIGWFGVLRCRRSLEILSRLAASSGGAIEVVLRGRPYYDAFEDFDAVVAATPNLRFEGPYKPADLERHYAETHFVWAIDYFEEGLNSAWLLPNRLYEGGFFGAVPIALGGVETGAWLARRQAGVLIDDPETQLAAFFATLDPQAYARLASEVAAIPDNALRAGRLQCLQLVKALGALPRGR